MPLSNLVTNSIGTEFIQASLTTGATPNAAQFYRLSSTEAYWFALNTTPTTVSFWRGNPDTINSSTPPTATFNCGSQPQQMDFVYNGANSILIVANLNNISMFVFNPSTVAGTINSVATLFSTASPMNHFHCSIALDGTTGYVVSANRLENAVSFWRIPNIISATGTINRSASFSTTANISWVQIFLETPTLAWIFAASDAVFQYSFNPTNIIGTGIASTSRWNLNFNGNAFLRFLKFWKDGSSYYLATAHLREVFVHRFNPNTDIGIFTTFSGGSFALSPTVQVDTSITAIDVFPNGSNTLLCFATTNQNRIYIFRFNPATQASNSSVNPFCEAVTDVAPRDAKFFVNGNDSYLVNIARTANRLQHRKATGFNDRSLTQSTTIAVPAKSPGLSKVSGETLTLFQSMSAINFGNTLRMGASIAASGIGNAVFGWAYTPGSEDFIGTIGENLIIAPGATITQNGQFTIAPSQTITFSDANYQITSLIFTSGSRAVISQNTTFGPGVIFLPGSIISGSFAATISYADPGGIILQNGATLIAPQIAVSAANFANGTRVQVAHRQIFTIASTAINISTDVITLGNDSNGDAANFRSTSPNTLIRFSLASGATIPVSTPQIFDGGLYYFAAGGQLSITEGGSPINFTSQGTGNFIITAETEINNSVVSGGSGYSFAFSRPNNAQIRIKAVHFSVSAGIASCSQFYDQVFAWSTTAGITILDTVNNAIPASQDPIHQQLIEITSFNLEGPIIDANGNRITSIFLPNDGSTITGFSLALEGTGKIQINSNDVDGVTSWQELYLWGSFVRSTQAGIRLASASTLFAPTIFNYTFTHLELDNTSSTPLFIVGGVGRSSDGSNPVAITSGSIILNAVSQGTGAVVATGGGGGLNQQDIRNAMLLAPSVGLVATGDSISTVLDVQRAAEDGSILTKSF